MISPQDTLAIVINADPDAIACALALKRIFWRRCKRVDIYRIGKVMRADNLALIKLLDITLIHVNRAKSSGATKWAIVDSQPHHDRAFFGFRFDIIIDHHPISSPVTASYIDIREQYGAASTILTEYLTALRIRPSPALATALFYGIKTDTDNFVRDSDSHDIIAFRRLYERANLNVIKKIETSEITKETLASFKEALDKIKFVNRAAVVHMGQVDSADTLVIVADFLLKLAEANWSVVSGIRGDRLVIILRYGGFRRNAGRLAQELFGDLGSAGGHQGAARAEILTHQIPSWENQVDYGAFLLKRIRARRTSLV
ncbi:DHH family phosphoesterase [Candidatus Fermentibacteria bacterium]|nr:DHH family phosphoesterase [Candidatus Fermentibacteria bacterium]